MLSYLSISTLTNMYLYLLFRLWRLLRSCHPSTRTLWRWTSVPLKSQPLLWVSIIYKYLHVSLCPLYLSICPSIYIYLSICLSISICRSISTCLSISICLSISRSPSISLSIYLTHLSVYFYIFVNLSLSVYLYLSVLSIFIYYLSFY